MAKQRKSKFVVDKELGSIKDIKSIKQVAEDQEAYDDILKDAVITRVANKGDNYITQTISYSVNEIEVDWDSVVYKYIHNGDEYFSNFKFNNPVETILPQINKDDTATA
jgi:hypothetical protein